MGDRFFHGRTVDAYLHRQATSRGYAVALFRGRHASELTQLAAPELMTFWLEVHAAGCLVDQVFAPASIDYRVTGTPAQHLQVHIVPRHADEGRAGPLASEGPPIPAEELSRGIEELRAAGKGAAPLPRVVHRELRTDMFVLHGGRFLVVTRRGLGERVEYLPCAVVEPGEDPKEVAIREVTKKTGLEVTDVSQLATWTYTPTESWEAIHTTFVGHASSRDVELTDEHSGYRWVEPLEFIDECCSAEAEAEAKYPEASKWFNTLRDNCLLVADSLWEASSGTTARPLEPAIADTSATTESPA